MRFYLIFQKQIYIIQLNTKLKDSLPNSYIKLDTLINKRIKKLLITNDFSLINYVNLSDEDQNLILETRNSNDIVNSMVNTKYISKEEHNEFLHSLRQQDIKSQLFQLKFYWAIFNKKQFIGSINLKNVNLLESICYSGLYLNPKLINSGLGSLIIYIQHFIVFEIFNISKIESVVEINNKKALKLNKFFGAEILKKISIDHRDFYPIFFLKNTWNNKIKYYDRLIKNLIR